MCIRHNGIKVKVVGETPTFMPPETKNQYTKITYLMYCTKCFNNYTKTFLK